MIEIDLQGLQGYVIQELSAQDDGFSVRTSRFFIVNHSESIDKLDDSIVNHHKFYISMIEGLYCVSRYTQSY